MSEKRRDHKGRILRDGESQRADHNMQYILQVPKTEKGIRYIPMTLNTYTHVQYEDAEKEMKRLYGIV